MLTLLTTLMITFTQAAVSERNQSTFSLGAACVEELDWCKDPVNFVYLSNCDTSDPQYDPTKCQTVYERFAQNDCISRTLRNEKSACAGVRQSFDKTAAFILESSVACAAFSAATESCVSEMSVVNPDFDQVDVALKCLITAAKDSKHQKNSQAKKCSRFERIFDGRRKLKGDISGFSLGGDNLLTGLCGCICPQDTCKGVYQCTQGERQKQLAQCPIPAPAPATANDVASTIKEKITSAKSTGLPVNPLDTLLSAVCGCICPEDDCMTLIPCTQGDYRRERRRCAAGPTRRLGENRLN